MKVSLFSRGSLGLSIAGLAIVLSAGSARANGPDDLLDFKFLNVGSALGVTISTDSGAHTESTSAGFYNAQLENKSATDQFTAVQVLCTDARHNIGVPDSYDTLVSLGTVSLSPAGTLIQEIYNSKYYYEAGFGGGAGLVSAINSNDYTPQSGLLTSQERANEVAYLVDYLSNPANSIDTNHAAAGQLAIWDIVQDGGDGVTNGSFRASGTNVTAVASLISGYETAAQAFKSTTNSYSVWIESGRTNAVNNSQTGDHLQDFAFRSSSPIPEASTLIGFGSLVGIGGLGLLRNKRTKK